MLIHIHHREKEVAKLRVAHGEAKILLTSLRIAGMALNLQDASRVIFVDFPPSASDALQAMARVYRIGQKKEQIIEFLLLRNSIDQLIAHRMEAKYLPILAGSASIEATDDEIAFAVEEKKLSPEDRARFLPVAREHVIHDKAMAMFRRIFGARTNFTRYGNPNIDLVAAEQQYTGENHELSDEKRKFYLEGYQDALLRRRLTTGHTRQSAYEVVASEHALLPNEVRTVLNDTELVKAAKDNAERKGLETARKGATPKKRKRRVESGTLYDEDDAEVGDDDLDEFQMDTVKDDEGDDDEGDEHGEESDDEGDDDEGDEHGEESDDENDGHRDEQSDVVMSGYSV